MWLWAGVGGQGSGSRACRSSQTGVLVSAAPDRRVLSRKSTSVTQAESGPGNRQEAGAEHLRVASWLSAGKGTVFELTREGREGASHVETGSSSRGTEDF